MSESNDRLSARYGALQEDMPKRPVALDLGTREKILRDATRVARKVAATPGRYEYAGEAALAFVNASLDAITALNRRSTVI